MDRILLVDDDVEVRPLLEHILLDNGYQVVTAESVATATGLLGSQPFDLVLCYVNLADGSGLTVADRAIAAGIKVLVVTRKDLTPQPGNLAPYDYILKPLRGLLKPLRGDELLDGIERCLAAAVEAHRKSGAVRSTRQLGRKASTGVSWNAAIRLSCAPRSQQHQTEPGRDGDRFGAAPSGELFEDPGDVKLRRVN